MYDNYDLMCGYPVKTWKELQKFNELNELGEADWELKDNQITKPTAIEIGWKDGNYITKECLTDVPIIINIQKFSEDANSYKLKVTLGGCQQHVGKKYYFRSRGVDLPIQSTHDFTFSAVSHVIYADKRLQSAIVTICEQEKLSHCGESLNLD